MDPGKTIIAARFPDVRIFDDHGLTLEPDLNIVSAGAAIRTQGLFL